MTTDLGPCGIGDCTAEAVAYVARTLGESGRLLVIVGSRAAELADSPSTADVTKVVCHGHAAEALDELLISAGQTRKAHR